MGSAGPGTEVVDGLGASASAAPAAAAASPVRREKEEHNAHMLGYEKHDTRKTTIMKLTNTLYPFSNTVSCISTQVREPQTN